MKVDYIPSLDGIRAVAVFIVLLSHAGLGHIIPGGLGVTVFFFLSGYLITTLLAKEYEIHNHIDYPKFFARRFFRLFPPLIICLALSYGLSFLGVIEESYSLSGFLYQVFYLANYHSIFQWGGETPNGLWLLWSLAVEEHFYLIFPLFLYACFRGVGNRYTPYILTGLCIIILGWRTYLTLVEGVGSARINYATDTRIDSILFGCIFALSYNPLSTVVRSKLTLKAMLYIGLGLSLLLVSLIYREQVFRNTLRYTLQGIALMPIFYYAIKNHDSQLFSWLNSAWIRKIGVYSYSIYLIHHVIINGLKWSGINNLYYLIGITIILSTIFAFLIDKYVEKYFSKMRKRLH